MATINCRKCKKEISDSAFKCPNCDVKFPASKPMTQLAWLAIIIVVGMVVFSGDEVEKKQDKSFFDLLTQEPTTLSALTTQELTIRLKDKYNQGADSQRDIYQELLKRDPNNQKYKNLVKKFTKKYKIRSQFHVWDGSHIPFEKIIKLSMNDPKSYEHVKSDRWEYDNHIVVKTTYRGKNGFNAIVTEWAKAEFDLDGNLLKVLSTSDE